MINCLLIEDENNSRDLLQNMINRYCPELKIIGTASSVESAVHLINEVKPELIFLDIQINGGTGFDVLNLINHKKIGIIFTTGYNDFAIKAFKYSAVDYLLKPIDFEELIDAVNKFKADLNLETDERATSLIENFHGKNELTLLSIPSIKGFTVHKVEDIISIQSDGSYSTFHIKNETLMASKPIGYFEDLLPKSKFYRIHNRTIVNLSMIREYIKGKRGTVVLNNGEKLEVSERRKEGLLKRLSK